MYSANNKGFTLLEVLIVVVIFAIGAAIAIPSIMDMGRRDQVKSEARQLKDQLARARAQAIEQNAPVLVQFDLGTSTYTIGGTTVSLDGAELTASTLPADAGGKINVNWNNRGYPLDSAANPANGSITVAGEKSSFLITISPAGGLSISKP